MRRLLLTCFAIAAGLGTGHVAVASAAFPGTNGKIVFSTRGLCCDALWSVNADGSDLRAFYQSPSQYIRHPEVSPDGQKIVVENTFQDGGRGVILDFSGQELGTWGDGHCQGQTGQCAAGPPIWSPHGGYLAWSIFFDAVSSANDGIWVRGTAGQSLIYQSSTLDPQSVRWSPDGTRLSFVDGAVYVINRDGTGLQTSTSQFAPDPGSGPTSPDGKRRVYTETPAATAPSSEIFTSKFDGTDPLQVTSLTEDCPVYPNSCEALYRGLPPPAFRPIQAIWQTIPIPDRTKPVCVLAAVVPGPPKQLQIEVQDTGTGIDKIAYTSSNATVHVPGFLAGTTDAQMVTATKTDQTKESFVAVTVTDGAGNVRACDPLWPAARHRIGHASRRPRGAGGLRLLP